MLELPMASLMFQLIGEVAIIDTRRQFSIYD